MILTVPDAVTLSLAGLTVIQIHYLTTQHIMYHNTHFSTLLTFPVDDCKIVERVGVVFESQPRQLSLTGVHHGEPGLQTDFASRRQHCQHVWGDLLPDSATRICRQSGYCVV